MQIVYGDVMLHFEHMQKFEFRSVYDESGSDFMYYHITVGAECEVAEWGTGGFDSQGEGIRVLSRIMLEPGQRLTVADDVGDIIVDVPEGLGRTATSITTGERDGFRDVNNGPKPIAFKVIENRPSSSTRVYFEIECWAKRCPGIINGSGSQPPVLSHRWEESHTIDRLFFCTRTVVGEIVFRGDVLRRINRGPDDFRSLLFPKIPRNFSRENISVRTSRDGLTCIYQITDKEQSRLIRRELANLHVQRVEASYFSGLDHMGTTLGLTGFMPVKLTQLIVECWGSRRCDMRQVAAFLAAFLRINVMSPFLLPSPLAEDPLNISWLVWDHKNGFTLNLKERYLKAELHFRSAINRTSPFTDIIRMFATKDFLYQDDGLGQGPVHQGTYVGRIISQLLKDPCESPKLPPSNPHTLQRRNPNADDIDIAHRTPDNEVA